MLAFDVKEMDYEKHLCFLFVGLSHFVKHEPHFTYNLYAGLKIIVKKERMVNTMKDFIKKKL
jgi:hypothetical protein